MSASVLPSTTTSTSSTMTTTTRSPSLDQSDAVTSLLSLGFAAAALPLAAPVQPPSSSLPQSTGGRHHRRLSSIGKTRRRLSDAKEASTRPLLAAPTSGSVPSTLSPASLSLAGLTLSTSPASSTLASGAHKPLAPRPSALSPSISASAGIAVPGSINLASGVQIISGSAPNTVPVQLSTSTSGSSDDTASLSNAAVKSGPITIGANGKSKKRGIEYKCESCGKIYRHPNCLNKHRWEHTQQWREASKFMQSKHSQVQILEAATILSYRKRDINELLPDDKTEWPSFLSGGSLPKTDGPKLNDEESKVQARGQPQSMPLGYGYGRRATSISYTAAPIQMPVRKVEAVPITLSVSRNSNSSVSASAPGPRLREFAIPTTAASTGPGGVVVVPHGLAPTHVKDEVEDDVDVDVDDEDQNEQPRRGADDDDIDIDIDVEEEREEEGVKERTYDVMSLHIDGGAHRTHVRSSSMRSSSSPRNPGLTGSASASSGDDEDEDVELELEGPAVPARDSRKRDVPGYGSAPSAYGYSSYGYPYPHASSYVSVGYAYAGYPASSGGPAAATTGYGIGSYGSTSGPGFSPSSYHARSGSYSTTFGGAWGSVREEEEDEEEDVNGRVSAVRGRGRYASREDDDMDVSSKVQERERESGSRWDGMEMEVDNMDMD